jgi:superfamily I DNA/RNA helicase
VYLAYEKELKRRGMWDDSDRVLDLLIRSQLKQLQPLACCSSIQEGTDYDKVYVDEIQDCTQAEITLFFVAAGLNVQSSFLVGDPAQAVVEGVDFRYEELRAIPYKLSSGREKLDRPITLFDNYRSHKGILLCAAAVLAKLHGTFPGAAKELPPDMGISQGPRPAFFQADGYEGLATLLKNNPRLYIMCPDEKQKSLSELGLLNQIFGIRDAKGMEFADVAIVDFFSSIAKSDQKPGSSCCCMIL